eukprot:PhM_4_TR3782/c0_g1_i1/m.70904/K06632/WEE1; wee1-like protein kinase
MFENNSTFASTTTSGSFAGGGPSSVATSHLYAPPPVTWGLQHQHQHHPHHAPSVPGGITSGSSSSIPSERLHREFDVIEAIGRGDFGTVWRARHRLDQKVYAVKQFNKKIRGETDRQRKLQEVYAQSSCSQCPHIVRYYESWVEDATLFVKMELCDGGSVYSAMPIGVYAWSEPELWDLLQQVALGLHALHARNIVHLDVKFENIYIKTVQGRRVYKIGDFGLVRPLSHFDDEENVGENDDEGDKRYLCATYLSRNTHWREADIFALGMSMYEAVTGVPVPTGGTQYQAVRRGDLPGMDHISTDLQSLLREMLHEDPTRRPTAYEVVARCAARGVGLCHPTCQRSFEEIVPRIESQRRAAKATGAAPPSSRSRSESPAGGTTMTTTTCSFSSPR